VDQKRPSAESLLAFFAHKEEQIVGALHGDSRSRSMARINLCVCTHPPDASGRRQPIRATGMGSSLRGFNWNPRSMSYWQLLGFGFGFCGVGLLGLICVILMVFESLEFNLILHILCDFLRPNFQVCFFVFQIFKYVFLQA
jgi:hypothetical protein